VIRGGALREASIVVKGRLQGGPKSSLPLGRVLIVEDEQAIAQGLKLLLEDEYEVVVASGGEGALELLTQGNHFDVVLCDLMMPDLSGIELYEQLKQNAPGTEERLLFMTGGAYTPEAEEFLERVPNPRVEKPFDLERMERLIRSVVKRRGMA
jgi:CheY-like chemotaxis protein